MTPARRWRQSCTTLHLKLDGPDLLLVPRDSAKDGQSSWRGDVSMLSQRIESIDRATDRNRPVDNDRDARP